MIKFEKTEIVGWEAAIRGMRNPMNSWTNSDSVFIEDGEYHDILGNSGPTNITVTDSETYFEIGSNDFALMTKLANGGSVHAKYRRMIIVYVDITAPLYWWKEFDTYKVGTVANSCSTMHKIHEKEFTLDDFSHEHLLGEPGYGILPPLSVLKTTIDTLNAYRSAYISTNTKPTRNYQALSEECCAKLKNGLWWQMIQLLPSSYNQKRTVMLNYEVLAGIYPMRKNHKLDEWRDFCNWIEQLPYSEIIIGTKEEENDE